MQRRKNPFFFLSLMIVFLARVPNVHSQQMHIVDPQINQNINSLLAQMSAPAVDIYAGPTKVTLKEALARWDILVLFDECAFEEEALSVDALVEAPFHGQSMLSYLDMTVASSLRLTWLPHEGGIMITTLSNSANMLCAWDISRLPKPKSDRSRRAGQSNQTTGSQWIHLIHSTVATDSWDMAGGTSTLVEIQIGNKTILVANAPFATSRKIHDLLHSLELLSSQPSKSNRSANPASSPRANREPRHHERRHKAGGFD